MTREFSEGSKLKLGRRVYTISEIVGKGASCVVYRATRRDNTEHLLKEYNPRNIAMYREPNGELCLESEDDRDKFEAGLVRFREGHTKQRELRLDSDLKNSTSNVQGIFKANGTEYIDMTCFAGDSYEKVTEKSVYDLLRRMKALAQVIGNYHKSGLLHLDIKPENIFTLPETCEMVMLFDFDSVVSKEDAATGGARSYTLSWAAPEQTSPLKRKNICEATDIFAVGEMIFYQLMDKKRHSTTEERLSFAEYHFDHKLPIFENLNPKVFPMLEDLLHHTICVSIKERYQSTDDLIAKLDAIIAIADPKAPYLKSSLPAVQEFFVGRENEIEEIHRRLSENRILFLNGIGGIGKSELAKHYADTYREEYDTIIFAPYVSDVSMLLQDDMAIPLHNFSRYPEEKPEDYCARKLRKLQDFCTERTLFIVDNLDREDDPDLSKLLDLECKLLITTRMDFSDYGYGQQLYLDALGSNDSLLEIFYKYYTKPLTDEETVCVEQIIDLVAGHTMTIELLAKQMMAGRVKPGQMLAKLQEGGISESGKEKVRSGKDGVLSARSAYNHIQALFDLSELEEDESYILANLALLPHTGIAADVFCGWSGIEGFDIINELAAEGWMRWEREKDYISLHPLISEIVLHNIGDTVIFENLIKSYTLHLRERNSADIANGQDHCEDSKINIHLLGLIERYNFENSFFEILLNGIGGELFIVHQYGSALRACELATKIAMKNHSAQSYAVTESISQMALVKAAIGAEQKDFVTIREAIGIYLQAIDNHKTFDKTEYPDNYEEIATLYSYAGMAYEDLDEIDSARDMYRKGIAVYTERTVLNSNDYLSLGILHNNLGNTYDGSEALKHYLSAKENHDKSGVLTRHAAITLYHLADIYSCEDDSVMDLALAAEYAQCVLKFFETEYSDDLYMIAEAKYMLGKVYSRFSKLELNKVAYTLLTEAEDTFVQFLPTEDRTIEKTRELIVGLCERLEK